MQILMIGNGSQRNGITMSLESPSVACSEHGAFYAVPPQDLFEPELQRAALVFCPDISHRCAHQSHSTDAIGPPRCPVCGEQTTVWEPELSPLYHGVTVRDAVLMVSMWGGTVSAATVRKWVSRGQVQRTKDGQIDPFTLQEWWDYQRNANKARAA